MNWSDVMQEWLEAQGDPEREKVVVNTRFGEAYERKGNFESHEQFMRRRENYGAELPEGVLLLTAAVDVQDNRLEYEICGWGMAEECWGIKRVLFWACRIHLKCGLCWTNSWIRNIALRQVRVFW